MQITRMDSFLFIGEKLKCQQEEANEQDPYAVVIVKEQLGIKPRYVVGQVPRRILVACSLFLQRSGNFACIITGIRHYSSNLPQGGLEVPCTLVNSSLRNT